jgi:hypothetical protein
MGHVAVCMHMAVRLLTPARIRTSTHRAKSSKCAQLDVGLLYGIAC